MVLGLAMPAWAVGGCASGHDQEVHASHSASMPAHHEAHGGAQAHHTDHHAGPPSPSTDCGDHCNMVMHCLAACMGGVLPPPGVGASIKVLPLGFPPSAIHIPSERHISPDPHPPRSTRI